MIRITQLKLPPDEGKEKLDVLIRQTLHLKKEEQFTFEIMRRSVDARKKPELFYIYTVLVTLSDERVQRRVLKHKIRNVDSYEPVSYRSDIMHSAESVSSASGIRETAGLSSDKNHINSFSLSDKELSSHTAINDPGRPVIIGTGPAGLFCALLLAMENLHPILIERGQRAYDRADTVQRFWDTGKLDPDSNVQFGEGGAGTFSDGKLNTGVKDVHGRIRFILEKFVEAGADPDILYSSKPHVGTDVLRNVVTRITDDICEMGGEVWFETRMDKISRLEKDLWKIQCRDKHGKILDFCSRHLVLAIGHSSRDTFSMLRDSHIVMSAKAFAVGVRIQHPQSLIDNAMYGADCRFKMGASSYKLTHRLADQRGVYSFCMCPGGYVVNASSEGGMLAVNGMSNHDRAAFTANSAIVVTITPQDIASYLGTEDHATQDVLIGMHFQRKLEKASFDAGDGSIPVQRFGDFAAKSADPAVGCPDFEPCIKGRWKAADIRPVFPEKIASAIEEGILSWERQIRGFSSPQALLCAAESRTSSPVRIERGEDFQAVGNPGLYPCGEGAGYAGGITSAAVDGLKVAEQILNHYYS